MKEFQNDLSPQFQPGDIVALKSGGPKMTITKTDEERKLAECVYFPTTDGMQYAKDAIGAAFPFAVLVK